MSCGKSHKFNNCSILISIYLIKKTIIDQRYILTTRALFLTVRKNYTPKLKCDWGMELRNSLEFTYMREDGGKGRAEERVLITWVLMTEVEGGRQRTGVWNAKVLKAGSECLTECIIAMRGEGTLPSGYSLLSSVCYL